MSHECNCIYATRVCVFVATAVRCMLCGEFDSQWGETALSKAAESGHTDCVRLLLDAGAAVNDSKNNVRVQRQR